MSSSQTLYKTQIRELKDECNERNKLYKEAQQQLEQYQEERYSACGLLFCDNQLNRFPV